MKKYIEHLKTQKTPHERRAVAARFALACTAVLFVVWVTTFGIRLAARDAQVANQAQQQNTAATLNAVQDMPPMSY